MTKKNKDNTSNLKLIKKHIKDLSFENPQSIFLLNPEQSSEHINIDFNVSSKLYEKDHMEVILRIKCNSSNEDKILFHLELDYLGFFKKLNNIDIHEDILTKEAVEILFPFAKSIIHDVSKNGGFITISLNSLDLRFLSKA